MFLREIEDAFKMNCAKPAPRFKILREVVKCVKVGYALLQWQKEHKIGNINSRSVTVNLRKPQSQETVNCSLALGCMKAEQKQD